VVSAGDDGTVRIWRVFESPHALIEVARARLPRGLTEAQRARYHLPPRVIMANSNGIRMVAPQAGSGASRSNR
jgi:hypothetical protein